MKAYRLHAWRSEPRFDDIPVPKPGPGEVLIRIAGAGVCSSDLHVASHWDAESSPLLANWRFPFTLGHENAGWIEAGDTALERGTAVVANSTWHCGRCRHCLAGATNYCEARVPTGSSGGFGLDGGMAEYLVAPSRCIVPIGDYDPTIAGPLADAALTTYHAVSHVLPQLKPDTTAVVIGVGGLGHLAVELLRELTSAQIIAVDRDEKALNLAASRGADLCLTSDETTAERIREATHGFGATAVLDVVGIDATLKMAAQSLRRMGRIVIVGIGGGSYPVGYTSIGQGCSIMTTLGGSMSELAEVVALATAGRLSPQTTKFKLEEAPEVFRKLHEGEINGRAVLTP